MREGQKRELARRLRRGMTDVERLLWRRLRQRQIGGCKFRRQAALGPYVVDFVCLERRLVVEADGGQHWESRRDAVRDRYLRRLGFRVVRFWNNEVIENLDGVLYAIAKELEK